MERVLVRIGDAYAAERLKSWAHSTPDGDLLDLDVLNHPDSFVLEAFSEDGVRAYVPMQRPLMMENLIFRPGLSESQTAQAIARLAEHAAEEAYRRDAGEIYFLCRDESTKKFAERHGFKNVADLGLFTYRLNLLETYGAR